MVEVNEIDKSDSDSSCLEISGTTSKVEFYDSKVDDKNEEWVSRKLGQTLFEEEYHPVHCTCCNNHVGYVDKDEVYHFFNVLSG
ncbi:E2F-associated phosphoprotein [Smittium mucronatum]|uniref:E2F-associated phosphoprotein n=1 Tax=Smittium mucronatum TaxID=133383 RepID=A0A1R0H0W2_9FUNG|nr:E2F-associated phosphoprotein [Smittium mucronatum]